MENLLASPKTTFLNLPVSKRDSIVREAVAEFAAQGYQRASINNIVKRLGIAKGSLYQYFENKESLFLYVFESFTQKVKQTVKASVSLERPTDFFLLIKQVLSAGIRFIDEYPDYFQVYMQVVSEHDVPQRDSLIASVRLFSLEYFSPLCEDLQRQGKLRNDISAQMVVFILDATMDRFLRGYARPDLDGGMALAGMQPVQMLGEIDTIIDVLRSGLLAQS
ncbi:MAG: TetR/AcrR family transcriptional regulator [Desulfobulbaceae bacterium]|nr:TetR/AcrR family transcriptional regulator [Desulfobulbaceae bacterium]HIJ80018.1 TetR/AcrR family transcriptional regulator [Deltaproteobacteria bacterium]